MPVNTKEWYVIVNPKAGSGKTMSLWNPAEKLLAELGVEFNVVYTTHKHHASELAAQAASEGYRRILAVGGDGSVHEIFCGVLLWCAEHDVDTSEFYLGVMPIGSGNDWIRSLGIPNDIKQVCRLIARESFAKQEVVRATSDGGKVCYIANCAGVGFDSHVCERVNYQKEQGYRASRIYYKALLYTVTHLKAINVEVRVDEQSVFKGEMYSLAMGIGKYSGGGLSQVPLAKMDDGLIDVMIVPKAPVFKILREMPRLLNETVHKSSLIKYFQCKKFEVIPLDSFAKDIFEVDGELEGTLPLTVEIMPHGVNILKP